MKKKYYYTYLVLCTQGSFIGKLYFGQHSTNNLNDGYIGSGRFLKDYLKKYPNGYIKIILGYYNSKEELDKAEYNLIHPFLGKYFCLNRREGGYQPTFTQELRDFISEQTKKGMNNPETKKKCGYWKGKSSPNKGKPSPLKGTKKSVETRQNMSNGQKGKSKSIEHRQSLSNSLKGTTRTIESRQKQSKTLQGHESYIKGRHRVYDNEEHTKWHFEY